MERLLCVLKVSAVVVAALCGPVLKSAEATTFRFAHTIDVPSMDPFTLANSESIYFMSNVYETLTRFDVDGNIEPALAVSWEMIEPTVWRFKLREGVTFHDGQPFSADDVLFSFERATAPGSTLGYAVRSIESVHKVDDFTVDIELVSPNAIIDREITFWFIMNEAWSREHDAAAPADLRSDEENFATRNANGTGPFRVVSREPGVRTVLSANADWWDEPEHNLTRVVFTPVSSDATLVAALLSGEVDLIEPVPLQDIARIEAADGLKVLTGPSLRTMYLGLNLTDAELDESNIEGANPLSDIRVRRAIYHAINVDAIVARIMQGMATPAGIPVSPMIFGYDESLNKRRAFDPEAASDLLKEAGYDDGFSVGLDCPIGHFIKDEEICQAIVPMLARVGIDVRLRSMNTNQFYQAIMGPAPLGGLYLQGWAGSQTMDASSILGNVLHSRTDTLGAYNGHNYSNAKVDDILADVLKIEDQDERKRLFKEMFEIVAKELPIIPMYYQHLAWAVRDGIAVSQGADNRIRLWTVNVAAD